MPVSSTISIEIAIASIYQNLLFSDWDWEKFHNLADNRNGNSNYCNCFSLHFTIILVLSFPPFS